MRVLAGLLAVVLVATAVAGTESFEELPLVHITTEHELTPLPSASVQKVVQDSQGFIWLAFYSSGVARYDGRRLEVYGLEDGLPSVTAREIVTDSAGRVWVGTESGLAVSQQRLDELAVGERLRFGTGVKDRPLVRARVHRGMVVADQAGNVWVATRGRRLHRYRIGVDGRLDESELRFLPMAADPGEDVGSLVRRRDGSVWLGTTAGRLLVVRPGSGGLQEVAQTGEGITALHEGPSGSLWGGSTTGKLWRLKEDGSGVEVVSRLLGEWVVTILETPDREVWAGSLGDGLVRIAVGNPARQRHLTRQHGLLSNTVWSLLNDREGNLWLAQNGGVSRLRPNFRAFGLITGRACVREVGDLPEPGVFCSLPGEAPRDPVRLWIGTGGGLLALTDDGCGVLDARHGLISNSAYALKRDQEGRIWVATPRGLSVLSFGASLPPPLAGSTSSRVELAGRPVAVRSYPWGVLYRCDAFELPAGTGGTVHSQWVAGTPGVAVNLGGEWRFFRERTGLPAGAATGLAMDPRGFLWVSTLDAGVYRSVRPLVASELLHLAGVALPDGGVEVTERTFAPAWDVAAGAPTDGVNTLLWIGERLWAGTTGGLAALSGSPIRVDALLGTPDGLGGDNVRGLAVSPVTGHIWVSQNAGAAEVDPTAVRVVRTVSKSDGLADNEGWAYTTISVGSDDTVYVATPKGLGLYRPWLDERRASPPLVAIRHAAFHQDWSGNNELVLEYAALTFTNEQTVHFRTRLQAYDPDWSEATTEARIRYTNLPAFLIPRTFTFEVTAESGEAVWAAQPARFTFRVRPAWWLSWVAVVAYTAIFVLSLVIYNHVHSRRLVRRSVELEREVVSRTAQIRSQATELETLDQIVEAINREMTLGAVLQALLDHGLKLVPQADKALFTVHDAVTGRYRVAAVSGWAPGIFDDLALTEQQALARYSRRAEQLREGVFIVRDFSELPGSEQLPALPQPRSMLSMTVTLEGKLEGFLVFDNFTDPEAFTGTDLRRLERFRQHAISAISKARLLEELSQRTVEAQQASAAKSAFLARMSHELRTPLNSIIGFSDILSERIGAGLQSKYQRFLQNISAAGTHLLGLINDILDLSKVEAGRMQLAPEPLAPRALAEGVITAMKGIAAERHIVIELVARGELPSLEADPVRVKQVLFNLLSNAVKFSPDGAVVKVELEHVPAEQSPVAGGAVAMAVIDRGIGIDPRHLRRIFEEFVQADDSTSRRYGGTGLGLALVKRFVEMHGGVVRVESTPGLGSTFRVILPCRFGGVTA